MSEIIEVGYPLVSDTGKRYRYLEPGLREYESGTLYRERQGDQKGRIVASPKDALITVDNHQAFRQKGLEARREKARKGFREAIKAKRDVSIASGSEAKYWGYVLGEAALREGDRSQVRALELVGEQVLDMKPKQSEDTRPRVTVRLSITGEVRDLRKAMASKYADVVVNGKASDNVQKIIDITSRDV